jgi:serine/threonine protein kinase
VAYQLVSALAFLYRLEVVHADLKPENVLAVAAMPATRAAVRLVDLGNAMHWSETVLYHDDYAVQSLLYRAPEVRQGPQLCARVHACVYACVWADQSVQWPALPIPLSLPHTQGCQLAAGSDG